MDRVLVYEAKNRLGMQVTMAGWVDTVRSQKTIQFLILRDHTGKIQTVHERTGEEDDIGRIIDMLTPESCVIVTGRLIANERVRLNQMELIIESISVASLAQAPLPIDEKTNLDQRLDWRFIDLRRPRNYLLFEVQTFIEEVSREHWRFEGFLEIHSPKLLSAASESGAELFRVDYFDGNAYLAQSPQFYKQMAMAAGFDRVFEIGPVFRANPSFTSRHDTEFTSIDLELSWIDSFEDVMAFEERWLAHVLEAVSYQHGRDILETYGKEVVVPTLPFPRVTMEEAVRIVAEQGYTIPSESRGDLDPEAERVLARYIKARYNHEFVFVTKYPASVRAFYHMRTPENTTLTESFDLIWNGLEVTTGAQREHRYDRLLSQVLEKGLSPESIQFYLDFFKYGCPPHGGFGFGLTRMLMILLGFSNVREVTYLYRGPNRLTP